VPIPTLWAYNEWFPFSSSIICKVAKVPYKFNKYRQHFGQCFGERKTNEKKIFEIKANNYRITRLYFLKKEIKLLQGLLFLYRNNLIDEITNMDKINGFIVHYDKRGRVPYNIIDRVPFVLNEIISGRYHKFSKGWRSALRDLLSF